MFPGIYKTTLNVRVDPAELKGDLAIPEGATGIVLFAHGSGSSRLSPRNQMVADFLNRKGIATFLFDLLSYSEDREYAKRFHLSMLTHRLTTVTKWLLQLEECRQLQPAYFGASTGAAAALKAASELPQIAAVVSKGGRPDLAADALPLVQSPTLLIVGSLDHYVLHLNDQALHALNCEKRLVVIQGASHLFEENGAMDQVCALAAGWFGQYFVHLQVHQ